MSKKVRNFAPVFEREKVMEQVPSRAAPKHFPKRPGGGMVDAVDSKSAVSNGVGVQVPPGVQKRQSHMALSFFFASYCFLLLYLYSTEVTIDVSTLPQGVYMLQYTSQRGTSATHFVVQ